MMKSARNRKRPGDLIILAILLANLLCGTALIVALRADLLKDLVAAESTLVSSKISAYLWGKILGFTSAVEQRSRGGGSAPVNGDADMLSVVAELPVEGNFQRIRSGTGELLPIYIGTPRILQSRRHVLPLGFLVIDEPVQQPRRYILGAISLADVDGYLQELRRRGIVCRIVDHDGQTVFGANGEFPTRVDTSTRFKGEAPVLGGALAREWSLQTFIPDAGSRLPILPQVILVAFFLLNIATFVFLRRRFILPSEAALAAVVKTVAAQGEILPSQAAPAEIAGAVDSLLHRCRLEEEVEKRTIRENAERRIQEISESQKNLLSHHRLTKKMLQSRQADEVFEILLGGVTEGYGFPGSLIGKITSDGYLVFDGETDPVTGSPLRIPLWNPGSLLARTFWSGNLFHACPRELPHLPEEESILGFSPVLCLPVMRNLKVRCVEAKNCADRTCPNFFSETLKCWLRNIPPEYFAGEGNQEIYRETIISCLRCEIFPSAALLVVRSVGNDNLINRENAVPISNLASEAGLALEVVSLYDNMKIMAVTDGLTGLFNHREFYQALRRELERARRYRHTLSLIMIDVDDFKRFNDRFGHPAGDFALRDIADLLRKCARATDIIARYGGEELAVILPESTPGGALMVAERIKAEVSVHNFVHNSIVPVHLTVSIGIYSSPNGEDTEDQVVSLADEASYTAKKSGKNRVVVKASS